MGKFDQQKSSKSETNQKFVTINRAALQYPFEGGKFTPSRRQEVGGLAISQDDKSASKSER